MGRDSRRKEDSVEEDGVSIKGVNERVEETGSPCVAESEEGDPNGFNGK